MRILFLSHRFPYPPTFGSKVRAFNVIKHLAQRQHQVSVLSLARSAQEAEDTRGIGAYCHDHQVFRVHDPIQAVKMVATLPSRVSASEAFFHSSAMQRAVDRLLAGRGFDFIFAHCSAVGRYVEHVQGLPKLIDYCDVDSRKWLDYVAHKPWPLRLGYRWEGHRVAATERRIAGRFDLVTVATPGEVAALAEAGVRQPVDWFPNGVDADFFQPTARAHDPQVITFVGRMDYFPNELCMVEFCAAVWPRLRRMRPSLRLQIVGAAPTPRVLALRAIDGVTVTGAVEDVRPYVQGSALTLAPLQIARGTQNKILEAMAMRVPVVASSIAAAGVNAVAGEHLLVADGPDQLCAAIERVLADPTERERLAVAGRERVLSHHGWPGAMRRLDGLIERCLQGTRTVERVATAAAGEGRLT